MKYKGRWQLHIPSTLLCFSLITMAIVMYPRTHLHTAQLKSALTASLTIKTWAWIWKEKKSMRSHTVGLVFDLREYSCLVCSLLGFRAIWLLRDLMVDHTVHAQCCVALVYLCLHLLQPDSFHRYYEFLGRGLHGFTGQIDLIDTPLLPGMNLGDWGVCCSCSIW